MIEKLTAKPGVIALQVTGHISREDVERCYGLLLEDLDNYPKIDLFIEANGISGFDTEAVGADFKFGTSLIGKLDHFGRVAVVSDDDWIRWASRIESALLPGISYRTYNSDEREQALAWVQGREDLPYGHAIKVIETTRADAVALEVDGRLSNEEISEVARELNKRREHGLRAVLVRFRTLTGVDPSIAANGKYLRMKLGMIGELERYAVVGGPEWLATWLKLWQPLLRMNLRHFTAADEDAAWIWLGAQPLADRSIAA